MKFETKDRWDGRLRADARQLPITDESVQCVVTSPPYWGLRDYSMCACRNGRVKDDTSTLDGSQSGSPKHFGSADPDCLRCSGTGQDDALAAQIGLEKTPEQYVEAMVGVFREVHRVLRPDGTLWLNLGSSYFGSGKGPTGAHPTFKAKDLVPIPWMVAMALQADGWYLRSEIIWDKLNPMPESVTDRPTKSHEQIFLLTKQSRYFYDADAIREPGTRYEWNTQKFKSGDLTRHHGSTQGTEIGDPEAGRNKRTVWHVATTPYRTVTEKTSHYATFPPKLIEPCILAGSRPGDIVLDPFAGSNTTGMVAEKFGRRWIACDLGYQDLQAKRLMNVQRELMPMQASDLI